MAEANPERGDSSPAALALAMGPADSAKANAFLDQQTALTAEQAALTRMQIRSLHVQHFSGIMKLAFEFGMAFIVLSVAAAIGGAVWTAAHDEGLVIEAFSVPPDLAARGLTGQVVASEMLDRLTAIQKATDSARPADSYSSNWGDDIKVQIPDTGISIGEFNRYLRGWLGHETHIAGEIVRTPTGIAVTARKSGDDGETFAGKETDLDGLIQQAALSVYSRTQPYRYAVFVSADSSASGNREAKMIFDRLIADPSPRERAWAYVGLANLAMFVDGDFAAGAEDCRNAIADDPDLASAWFNLELAESLQGHAQAAFGTERTLVRMLDEDRAKDLSNRAAAIMRADVHATFASDLGDFGESLRWSTKESRLPDYGGNVDRARQSVATDLAFLHEVRAAHQSWERLPATTDPQILVGRLGVKVFLASLLEQWEAAIALNAQFGKYIGAMGPLGAAIEAQFERPTVAYALARSGDRAGALARIANTSGDCYVCLFNRGRIDTVDENWSGAAYWFARAVREAPDLPIAYSYWARMLFAKGDFDGTFEKSRIAHEKGPHFADPLEMWGEALMAKNRSDLALAKFEEADKYASHWGRLHLKWGEALIYAGRKPEARNQFALAASLDLSPADKTELANHAADES